jgi:dihydroorotate dehydrogenase (fumarate)
MIDLSTTYLGLRLRTPSGGFSIAAYRKKSTAFVTSKMQEHRPWCCIRCSKNSCGRRASSSNTIWRKATDSFAEAASFFPQPAEFHLGPEGYLNHIRRAKEAVDIPIIASLNGTTVGGWTEYAKLIEQAGADALECNIYSIPTDPELSSVAIEQQYFDILKAVKSVVTIPVAVKLSPFFSNMANMAKRLDEAGANALVLFNRFYQPDINLDELEIQPNVLLSTPQALRLPLTWIGILYGRIRQPGRYQRGARPGRRRETADGRRRRHYALLHAVAERHQPSSVYRRWLARSWMEKHEYESVQQMKGSMSQLRCSNPSAFERAQYMKAVKSVQHVRVTGREAWRILSRS